MNIVIISEYIINTFLIIIHSMHMFQLNSYLYKKHINWIKTNANKIIINVLLLTISTLFIYLNMKIIAIILLAISILYNIPKTKSKVPVKYTHRVLRLFITESFTIFLFVVLFLTIIKFNTIYIFFMLYIINILAFILCIIANFINSPIESFGRKMYINKAKKILSNYPNLIVIGVTGSYGKTSVKTFLEKTLSAKYEVLVTPKNYNTTLGVVKTISEYLKPIHQIFICEMGATHIGDIKEICDIVNPTIGVITSIGPQHLESFKSIDNIIKTKFELADAVRKNNGTVFLNYDNEYLANYDKSGNINIVNYGINNSGLEYNAFDVYSTSEGLSFKILDEKNNEIELKTKLIGKHNAVNIVGAIAVANKLGVKISDMIPNIRSLRSVEHRLEIHNHGNLTIIDDSYNSNPISSKSALNTLSEFEGTKIIITPGLIELGEKEEKYNFEFGENIANICDFVFLVESNQSNYIIKGLESKKFKKSKIYIVKSPNEAIYKITKLKIETKNITALIENDLPDNYNI